MQASIKAICAAAQRGERFAITDVVLDEKTARVFVELRHNPARFTARVFTGDWAVVGSHAAAASIRLLAVVVSEDGVVRLIGRQGANLYAISREKTAAKTRRKRNC